MVSKQFIRDSFGWGFLLWFVGYLLGFLLFAIVPPSMLGWVIMPIGTVLTLWVLLKKVKQTEFKSFLVLGAIWLLIAVFFDYLFLVKILNPVGYYKFDVYLYYILTIFLPLIVGKIKSK